MFQWPNWPFAQITHDSDGSDNEGRFRKRRKTPARSQLLPSVISNRAVEHQQRVEIYKETMQWLKEQVATQGSLNPVRERAEHNLQTWVNTSCMRTPATPHTCHVYLVVDDSLNCTYELTRRYGQTFAVLNMANAYTIYGGVRDGSGAQEENMVRRTTIIYNTPTSFRQVSAPTKYTVEASALINAMNDEVMLVTKKTSVCLRESEDYQPGNIGGYAWMKEDEWFPFYELRSAALNVAYLKRSAPPMYCVDDEQVVVDMRRRIRAQFKTLMNVGVKHVVLSAFGCGAFGNDAFQVAELYVTELESFRSEFDVVAFSIFYAGFGETNYQQFHSVFDSAFGQTSGSTAYGIEFKTHYD